ncbi:sensor histidine kinase [Leptospira bandrabouensis]|uniref:histidine kinase n=1 Tax=Leptospira bandrabouensis TaxID=2484903 RepID=A0A6H3NPV5_9LEPT|nr:ATP-binding protein [Leptospira bandrabouensis]MCG6151854.1 sensor histidine kinase [Leptospira bandrabouensis]TGN09489.1 sensor histidine kinase [Leptospira bandrabouensis]TGN10671.1 sensor histidine kinase [Leptospira bandrabouensis]
MIPHSLLLESKNTKPIAELLKEIVYTFERVNDLEEIAEKLEEGKFHFLIFHANDIENERDQKKLSEFTINFPHTLIILITDTSQWGLTASLLKRHSVYDFIQTPVDQDHLKFTLDRSFLYLSTKLKSQFINDAENNLYKRMVEIFDWKKSISNKENENIAADIIHQMNINLFQGSGIGTLMSVVSILISKSKLDQDEKNYSIPKPVMDLLSENYEAAKSMFDSMSVSQSIIDDQEQVNKKESPTKLLPIIERELDFLNEALSIKNQKINLSQIPISATGKKIRLDETKISYAIREVLINAIKYSKDQDIIYLLFFQKENFLELKVINPAYQNDDGSSGIPEKFESLVFEPFFRISSVVDDSYAKFEQFRFGLGLPLVKKIMDQHLANVQIYNIENNFKNENTKDICLTIRFPLLEEEK